MKLLKKNKRGYTLIEILISIVIIGIIAVFMLPIFTSSFSTIFAMGRRTQAMNHEAQMYMDQIYNGTKTIAEINDLSGVSVATSSLNGMTLVKITVDYDNGRSLSLSSLVP